MEFEQVYRTCFDQVFRYLCRLTGDCSLAEELTAETFFRAMKALDSFRNDCPLQVWLCGIARRTYLSHLRKNREDHPRGQEKYAHREKSGGIRDAVHPL